MRIEKTGAVGALLHVEVGVDPDDELATGDRVIDALEAGRATYLSRVVGGRWVIEVRPFSPRVRALVEDALLEL